MVQNPIISTFIRVFSLVGFISVGPWPAAAEDLPEIPKDLLGDEHIREEFGVNKFTTPSIRKLFEELDALGTLPYDKLKRTISDRAPRERSVAALSLGVLIADGFLVVQSDQIIELKDVGGAIVKHAKILGSGKRVIRHVKSILEKSALDDLAKLKSELASTQADVEAEMVLLRDVDIAHLVAVGGWCRAFQIASNTAIIGSFKPKVAQKLARVELLDYFVASLEQLDQRLQEKENVKRIQKRLKELREAIDLPAGKSFTEEQVVRLAKISGELVKLSTREFRRRAASAPGR